MLKTCINPFIQKFYFGNTIPLHISEKKIAQFYEENCDGNSDHIEWIDKDLFLTPSIQKGK